MYKIKQVPEDFIVKEISSVKTESTGHYSYYILKKVNCTTVGALQALSEKFKIPLKHFGFAGNKDKNAVTSQKISILNGSKNFENIKLNNIELKYLGSGKGPISLGDLKGNEFAITIRNLGINEINKIKKYINKIKKSELLKPKKILIANFFGIQRFSRNNHLVGKAIIKRDFKKAVELILENSGYLESQIRIYLQSNKNNYAAALRMIPLKTRKLLVHSYQSFLFNETVKKISKGNFFSRNIKIPIIGFDFELESIKNKILKGIIKKIMDEEEINPRDFIISQMPELTCEGTERDLFFRPKNLDVLEIGEDELNQNKKKIKIKFNLPKGCYATVLVDFLMLQKQN